MSAEVLSVRKLAGIAGQVQYVALVKYEGEEPSVVSFVGSSYGGPVVMLTPANPAGVFVTDPGRFGVFIDGPEWVGRFFA